MRMYGTKKLYAKGHVIAWKIILGGFIVYFGIVGVTRYTNLLMPATIRLSVVMGATAIAVFAFGAWLMYRGARGTPD